MANDERTYEPRNPNDVRIPAAASMGSQGNYYPGLKPAQPITPSFIHDLQQQQEILHLTEERINSLEQHLNAILPREPEQSATRQSAVIDRLYSSAGASLACELAGTANDRLMRLNMRLERLIARVEI